MVDTVEIEVPASHREEFHDMLQVGLADLYDALPHLDDETLIDHKTGNPPPDADPDAVRAAYREAADNPETVKNDLDMLFVLRDALRDHETAGIYDDYRTTIPRGLCESMAKTARDDAAAAEQSFDDGDDLTDLAERYRDVAAWLEQAAAEQ